MSTITTQDGTHIYYKEGQSSVVPFDWRRARHSENVANRITHLPTRVVAGLPTHCD